MGGFVCLISTQGCGNVCNVVIFLEVQLFTFCCWLRGCYYCCYGVVIAVVDGVIVIIVIVVVIVVIVIIVIIAVVAGGGDCIKGVGWHGRS